MALSPMSSLIVSLAKPTLFRSRNAMKYSQIISGRTRRRTLLKVRSPSSPNDAPGVPGMATTASVENDRVWQEQRAAGWFGARDIVVAVLTCGDGALACLRPAGPAGCSK